MKRENNLWGIFFIVAAVLMLVGQLDVFQNINFFRIFVDLLLLCWLVYSILKREFFGILFSIAFFCILYDEMLGIEKLTPFPVLAAALLGGIGLNMLFKKKINNYNYSGYKAGDNPFVSAPDSTVSAADEIHDDQFSSSTLFGSNIKYVRSNNLQKAYIQCNFGDSKIYFDDALVQDGKCNIILDVHFGGVSLFIPKNWHLINKTNVVFGGIEEKNASASTGAPTVYLSGNVAFGGVDIIYC